MICKKEQLKKWKFTHNKIYLNNQCSLIWGEVLTCGRKLNDEVFQFSKHHNITEIFLNNKLIIKENLLMQPSLLNPNSMGQLEGFTHQASFIYFDESIDVKALCDKLYNSLSDKKEISFGVSTTQYNSLIIRILGYKAEQLYDLLKEIAASIQTSKIAHYAV